MSRIILLLIIGFLVYLAFKGFFKSATKKEAPPPAKSESGEDMVKCARCGVNLPRSDVMEEDGRLVCRDNPKCIEARP